MKKDPKVMKSALKQLAKAMVKLHLDKLEAYKKVPEAEDEDEDDMMKVLEARKKDV